MRTLVALRPLRYRTTVLRRTRTMLGALIGLVVAACAPSSAPSGEPSAQALPSETVAPASPAPSLAPSASSSPPRTMPPEAARAERGVFADGVADTILRRGEPPRIQLDDPGREPREVLVYALAPSTSQAVTMRMDLALAVAGEASPTTVQFPTIALTLALATSSRDAAAGEALVEGTLREVRIEPHDERSRALAAPLERQLRALRGARLAYRMSPQGRARGLDLTPASNAPTEAAELIARMKGSFESMVAPLPDGPIGLGARWTVTSRSGGHADLVQWTTYTLRARDGSRFTVDTEVAQIAAGRTVAGGALPPGTEATIASFDARGSGTTTLDLLGLLPERGQGTIETSMTIRALGSLGETKTNVTVAFEPAR